MGRSKLSRKVEAWLYNQQHIQLEIVKAEAGQQSFAVQPQRWVVVWTFAWLGKYRRLSKDYERDTLSSEGLIYLATIRTLLKRFPVYFQQVLMNG